MRPILPAFVAILTAGFPSGRRVPDPGPLERADTLTVTIREGTNMAAALSPDGREVALDLLGRIWVVAAGGGSARPLTDADGDARQPAWSPDGSRIVFHAYWSGDYDLWTVRSDGSDLTQVTSGLFDDREPHWSPDGTRVAFASDRSGTYDLWEVRLADLSLTRVTSDPGDEYGPTYSPDGRYLAYVRNGSERGIWVHETGGSTARIAALDAGQAGPPAWSPDGSQIAYQKSSYGESTLVVAATSGMPGGTISVSNVGEDVFPFRPHWSVDGRLLYTADGKMRLRSAYGGAATDVPFVAEVTLDRPDYARATRDLDDPGPRPVRGIVSPALSPDGSSVAFSALGDLWVMPIGAEPRRLTDDPFVEVDPMWSPDGLRLAFASDRGGSLDIYVRDLATGRDQRVSEGGGALPAWSPDGREIAFHSSYGPNGSLRVLDVATGASRLVRAGFDSPGRPTWSPDGSWLAISAFQPYSGRFREGVNKVLLLPAKATPTRPGASLPVRFLDVVTNGSVGTRTTDGPVWSPDGRRLAYVAGGVLWAIPVDPSGAPLGPPERLNDEISDDPTWAGDSRSILYLGADRLRRVWLDGGRIEDVPVPLTWSRALRRDRVLVHAGGLFDGVSEELRHDVDVLVVGNRIASVEPHRAEAHAGAEVVDASDGVLAPGLIEMHAHGGLGGGERIGRQWLAFGVTSVRNPSADAYEIVEAREAEAVSRRVGPRMFGTGGSIDGSRIFYQGAPSYTNPEQVALELARARALGYDLVKTYVRLPDALQRRVIEEAHASGMLVTSHELYPAVAYGADGVEHVRGTSRRGYNTKASDLNRSYQDVVELLARSRAAITPTVGISGAYALLALDDPSLFEDDRVATFFPSTPRVIGVGVDPEARRRMVRDLSSLARRVVDAGGVVVVGTDAPTQPEGLSLVAEMEALVRYGGMRPVDVMRAATSVSAGVLGYGGDLGRIAPGLLADLVILGTNPLEDIRAVRDVRTVVKDGRVYDVAELLEAPRD